MNTSELAQILLNIPSVGGARTKNIIEQYNGGSLSRLIRGLYPFIHMDDETVRSAMLLAEKQLSTAQRAGITLLSWKDESYPSDLLSISDFPPLLYGRGNVNFLKEMRGAALIGSRRAGPEILELTGRIGSLLVDLGYTVVSGLAAGCDRAAHQSALRAGGATVALMPCGPDYIYPRENHMLYHEMIVGCGLVLSEYAPSVPPAPYRFVRRDRLQSGLSRFVLLMQSPLNGGSMHTAAAALKQRRPLFVYAGEPDNPLNEGNRYLIDRGLAIPFRTPDELGDQLAGNLHLSGDCHGTADQILFSYE